MAGYTKTYSGDLTTTIASKLFDAVKNKIEKNRDEKQGARRTKRNLTGTTLCDSCQKF